jgi:aldehyde dehydrogenase (NAD+)
MAKLRDGKLLINGVLRDACDGATFPDFSPWTGEEVGRAADATESDVSAAIAAARTAFDATDWSTDHAARAQILKRYVVALKAAQPELSDIVRQEAGATMGLVRGPMVGLPLSMLDGILSILDSFEWDEDRGIGELAGGRSRRVVRHEAIGVVAAITPWNMPLQQNLMKCVTAMAAGCTVVLKPSPETPLAGAVLGRLALEAALPNGALNVVTGKEAARLGEQLVRDPRVDLIAFTGSTRVGRRIMELGAPTLKRLALELGGKSARIILEDADFAKAVAHGAISVTMHSGQGCALPTRMLVPRSRYAEAEAIIVNTWASYKWGDPDDPSQIMGPLITAKQRDRVLEYIEIGKREGARVASGGKIPADRNKGNFVEPTLLADVSNDMRVAQEEIFGPVLCLIAFDDDDDAIRIANDTEYGLSGQIVSGDVNRARRIANALRVGTAAVNGGLIFGADIPFGGYKQSGIGRELGVEGFEEFLEVKTIGIPG